jgi:hypothetical protein
MKTPRILHVLPVAALAACDSPRTDDVAQTIGAEAGVADGGVIDGLTFPESPPTPPEPTIAVVREFTCDPLGVLPEQPVAQVAGTAGDELVIVQTESPCQFHLVYRSASSGDTTLSAAPAGYLLAAGADRVICASPILHHAELDEAHVTDAVPLDCALRSTAGVWQPMQRIVDPGGAWAAWVNSVERNDDDTYTVEYMRDFSFQFANVGNLGRPAEDGIYEQTLEIVGDSLVAAAPPIKVTSNFTNPTYEDPTPGCPVGEIDPNNPACFEPDAGP